MKKVLRMISLLVDCVFLLRPVVIIPVWGFALFGFFKGCRGSMTDLPALWGRSYAPFLWIVVFSISAGSVYVLNQIADIEVDKKNGGLPLLACGITTPLRAWVTAMVSGAFSIMVPAAFGHPMIALLSAATILIGILYSFRPTFFSGRVLLDFFTNGIGFGVIAFGAGWYLAGREFFTDFDFLSASLPYFLLMCAGSISSTIPDIAGDREGKKYTTAVVLGEKNAHLFALLFVVASSVDALLEKDVVASACSIVSLPFYILFIIFPKKLFAEAAYKVGGALCMVAAGCIDPIFFICAFAVFLATRMYFRLRHGVIYPSLAAAETPVQSTGKTSGPW